MRVAATAVLPPWWSARTGLSVDTPGFQHPVYALGLGATAIGATLTGVRSRRHVPGTVQPARGEAGAGRRRCESLVAAAAQQCVRSTA